MLIASSSFTQAQRVLGLCYLVQLFPPLNREKALAFEPLLNRLVLLAAVAGLASTHKIRRNMQATIVECNEVIDSLHDSDNAINSTPDAGLLEEFTELTVH